MSDLSAFALDGKRVLVTGANTGIGQGIAVSIAKAGTEVIAVGRPKRRRHDRLSSALAIETAMLCPIPVFAPGDQEPVCVQGECRQVAHRSSSSATKSTLA